MATWEIQTWSPVVEQVVSWTTFIGSGLLVSFMTLKIGWEYFRASTGMAHGGNAIPIDFNELARVILLVVVMNVFVPIAKSVTFTIKELNEVTQMTSSSHKEVAQQFNEYYISSEKAKQRDQLKNARNHLNYLKETGAEAKKIESHKRYIEKIKDRNPALEVNGTAVGDSAKDGDEAKMEERSFWSTDFLEYQICLITLGIMQVIKVIMGSFISILFQIGIIFGPLVIAMSMFWKSKLPQYIEKMLSVGLTFTTFNLMDLLVAHFMNEGVFNNAGLWETIAFNLTCIAVYLSAFKVTAMFIGSTGFGGIANTALGGLATGAAATMWLGSKMAGAAAGGGGGSKGGGGTPGGGGGAAATVASVAKAGQKGAERIAKSNVE